MKLIIVDRTKFETFQRLKAKFIDDLNVEVIFERRTTKDRRQGKDNRGPERRSSSDRRRLSKAWNSRDYVVIQIASKSAY